LPPSLPLTVLLSNRQQLFWTAQRFVSSLLADRATVTEVSKP
jgi:hypothetical protein